MRRIWNAVAVALVAAAPAAGQSAWEAAARQIVRHPPAEFPEAPAHVRAALADAGCRIPQAWGVGQPSNLVHGAFAVATQVDWAALCSDGEASRIVVVWGGPERCSESAGEAESDQGHLQQVTQDEIAYARFLRAERITADGYVIPPGLGEVTHDAISDWILEKGGVAHYCEGGSWWTIPGGH